MFVIKYKEIFLTIAGLVVAAAIACIGIFGLSFGIDFTGGSILEVEFTEERPPVEAVEEDVAAIGIESASVRPTGESGYIIRTPFLEENQRSELLSQLSETAESTDSSVEGDTEATTTDTQVATSTAAGTSSVSQAGVNQRRFSSIGPTVGSEITQKAIYGIIAVVVGIILFVAFAFRKVSEPVSSWVYGSVAVVALIHDILVPTGIFAVLGHTMGAQVDLLFVMALLAILGFSVNDTIVVFDRIRENLQSVYDRDDNEAFSETVGRSLNQVYPRSVNTSVTTLIVLAALYFLGGQSTELFSLTLLIGVVAGTYSSIFLASPLLVQIREWQTKNK